MVRHRGGDEGIDELWGEPFKAFSVPVEDFYESRYLKIAQTMRDIDRNRRRPGGHAGRRKSSIPPSSRAIRELADAAKHKCETLRTDPVIFEVWPVFVVAGERLTRLEPKLPRRPTKEQKRRAKKANRLSARDGHPAGKYRPCAGFDAEEHAGIPGPVPPIPSLGQRRQHWRATESRIQVEPAPCPAALAQAEAAMIGGSSASDCFCPWGKRRSGG